MTEEAHEDRSMKPEDLRELRRLAGSRPKSGRERLAKVSALRVLERLAREEAARKRQTGEYVFPWENGPDGPSFELYVHSETEKVLFGCLAAPRRRPEHEERQIDEVVNRLIAAPDPPAAFREWLGTVR